MTAEALSKVVADLKAGTARPWDDSGVFDLASRLIFDPVVIDVQFIFDAVMAKTMGTDIYEDHPNIAPPWSEMAFCFTNSYENVFVMHSSAVDIPPEDRLPRWPTPPDHHVIEWDRVRWVISTYLWMGGYSTTMKVHVPTTGPLHRWDFAVYDKGEPADLHWTQITAGEEWDSQLVTLLGALNFLSCRNVGIREPERPRAERRRLERTGVTVHTINVYPPGTSSRSTKQGVEPSGGHPIRSTRGHFAHYGPEYNKGLLFGKLAGKFWIPNRALDQVDYRLIPAKEE